MGVCCVECPFSGWFHGTPKEKEAPRFHSQLLERFASPFLGKPIFQLAQEAHFSEPGTQADHARQGGLFSASRHLVHPKPRKVLTGRTFALVLAGSVP